MYAWIIGNSKNKLRIKSSLQAKRRKAPSEELRVKNYFTMKKESWKTILQVLASIITAALTALGTTSCMGHGPF